MGAETAGAHGLGERREPGRHTDGWDEGRWTRGRGSKGVRTDHGEPGVRRDQRGLKDWGAAGDVGGAGAVGGTRTRWAHESVSVADRGTRLTPRRHTLSSRIAIMCSGPDRAGAQHPPGPGPRRAHAKPASSSLRLFLAAPAGGTATAAISRPPALPRSVTCCRPAPPGALDLTSLGPSSQERPRPPPPPPRQRPGPGARALPFTSDQLSN